MGRPKGSSGTKQLTEEQRARVRHLFYDAGVSQPDILAMTGFTKDQVRGAIKAKSAAVGVRTGRPRKTSTAKGATNGSTGSEK